jgi:hypothetical protein
VYGLFAQHSMAAALINLAVRFRNQVVALEALCSPGFRRSPV